MKAGQLIPRRKQLFKVTTKRNSKHCVVENQLKQNFHATRPNEKWVSDITYVRTQSGWLYVAAMMDLFSRKIVGLAMGHHLKQALVINAFRQAITHRGRPSQLIVHSDRGCQYTGERFQRELAKYCITSSMSGVGNCYDNAAMESFFATLKTEWVNHHYYQTREQAMLSIFDYTEVFYNNQRKHSYCDYLSPDAYEKAFLNSE